MLKWKELKNKPITWGDYAKLCKWSFGISAVIVIAEYAYLFKDEIGDFVADSVDTLNEKIKEHHSKKAEL